ncbi:MAG: phosphatase PAP2 family protein [Terriglobia bacterium]
MGHPGWGRRFLQSAQRVLARHKTQGSQKIESINRCGLAAAVGFSQVTLQAHFTSDVFAGAVLAIASATTSLCHLKAAKWMPTCNMKASVAQASRPPKSAVLSFERTASPPSPGYPL